MCDLDELKTFLQRVETTVLRTSVFLVVFWKVNVCVVMLFVISEVRLYLIILEALEKYDKAIEVLQGPLGGKNECLYCIQRLFYVKLPRKLW